MILSAEYSQCQDKMSSCLPQSVLHTPRHPHLYTSYLMDSSWHHPLKQEPEDSLTNNDSGISPSHYNSDGSAQNTSPQSYHSEARSDDSGQADHQTNATLGVLARPVMEALDSPKFTLPRTVTHSPPQNFSPHNPSRLSPQQLVSPVNPNCSSPQNNSPLNPEHLSPPPQPHPEFNFLQPETSSPRSPRPPFSPSQHSFNQSPVAIPPASSELSPKLGASVQQQQEKAGDDSRHSSASSGEMDMYFDDPLRGLQMALQRRGMMGPLPVEQPVNGEKPLECPLCQYSTTIRSAFNNHLMSEHSEQVSCHLCEFTAENHVKLKEHLRVEHDTQLGSENELCWGEDDELGVTTPKVNSQGKVKTYRCKQCDFSTVTKLDFWEHTRGHIKPERLLTCPKCPFVTEYKHHLEYHLRNHFGSKPFKCDKCSYTCVNKSMLNSHRKSHSNVYQFRCADCAYATKYCHSLKLHLRKYGHNPAMVLNPDGSPNPLPIVDVYGTRRGPKRPKKPEEMSSPQQSSIPAFHSMFSNPYGFLPSQAIPYPYNALMNSIPRNPLLAFPGHHQISHEEPAQSKLDPGASFFNATLSTIQQSTINNNQEGVKEYLTKVMSSQQEITSKLDEPEEEMSVNCLGAPLDLSRQEPQPPEQPAETSSEQLMDQSMSTKNRRKGKAFKLERIAQRLQQQSSDEEDCGPSPKQLRFDYSPEHTKEKTEEENIPPTQTEDANLSPKVNFCNSIDGEFKSTISEERKLRWKNVKEVYDCPYCDMLFGDVIMYTMHMGYHGYQNPYTCNMCGHQTSDRVQFFLHLFRYAHN